MIGHELVAQRHSVLPIPACCLVPRLLAAERALTLEVELRKLDHIDAVILDDLGRPAGS